jgi:hypothetical protein
MKVVSTPETGGDCRRAAARDTLQNPVIALIATALRASQ